MKVSVIVPVYNVEDYIEKCLLSIQKQTLKDFECLIIDDGSPDNSIEKAKALIGNDARFAISHKVNGGLSDARNYGLDLAIGDYVCFVDSDDYIEEDMLEKVYDNAVENDSDIVCFDLSYVYEDGRREVSKGADFKVSSYEENDEIIFINNSANNKLYRRKFMKDRSFIKGMWYEDLASVPVWLAKAKRVSYVAEPLYNYVQRDGSISHSADPRIFDVYKAISRIKEELNLDSYDVNGLYLKHCLVATTLRIRGIEDKKVRREYFEKNIELLNENYEDWYRASKDEEFSFKHRVVFWLLKHKWFSLLNLIY